ncbi:MAG: hypothetical protein Q4G28_04315 [Neisseria sp.]|nr:hypothetical protein [Neisseria sp.]
MPGIGRYDGGGYTLTGKAAKKQPQKAGKSARQRPKKTADSKKKTTEKAAAQSKQRVKGNGYRGFPTMARKEVK